MSESIYYPRYVEPRLAEVLEDSLFFLILGQRLCGKTALTQFGYVPDYFKWKDGNKTWGKDRFAWGSPRQKYQDYTYISFDDAVVRDGAQADPILNTALEPLPEWRSRRPQP